MPWHQQVQPQVSGILGERNRNQNQTKTNLSFLTSSVPHNKRGCGRRWTGIVPAQSTLFLTVQGNSAVIQGLPVLPRKGTSWLEQGVLGFGSVLSFWFISAHPGVLMCFPCCVCCTQSCHIWAGGIFLWFSGLGLPSSCIPDRGFFTCSTTCAGEGSPGQVGSWGCPGCPSQVPGLLFLGSNPNTRRLMSVWAFDESFFWFCFVF